MPNGKVFKQMGHSRAARDPAVTEIKITIDTSKWSSRKKNIIIEALRSGVATCGYDNGELAEELSLAAGSQISRVHKWSSGLPVTAVDPDKYDDLIAITAAWIKLRDANQPENSRTNYLHYWERAFIKAVEQGGPISQIPIDRRMSTAETAEFLQTYAMPEENVREAALNDTITAIETGEIIELTYT